jgi:hypothetical protein
MAACKRLQDCVPGTFQLSVPQGAPATLDRQCRSCPVGKYSSTANALDCTACLAGLEYQDKPGQVACLPADLCDPGTAEATAATSTANTQCEPCDGITAYADVRGML